MTESLDLNFLTYHCCHSLGSALYYTGEISMHASPVYFTIDSEDYPVVNISDRAKAKGMKVSQSDIEILFSVTGLSSDKTHTWTMHDYDDGNGSSKFLTLYRLTLVHTRSYPTFLISYSSHYIQRDEAGQLGNIHRR